MNHEGLKCLTLGYDPETEDDICRWNYDISSILLIHLYLKHQSGVLTD